FPDQVQAFALEVGALLGVVVLESLNLSVEFATVGQGSPRATITLTPPDENRRCVRAAVSGNWLAGLTVSFGCRPDHTGKYLAANRAAFGLWSASERTPLFRLEYLDNARSDPYCHWQVHAERGA